MASELRAYESELRSSVSGRTLLEHKCRVGQGGELGRRRHEIDRPEAGNGILLAKFLSISDLSHFLSLHLCLALQRCRLVSHFKKEYGKLRSA